MMKTSHLSNQCVVSVGEACSVYDFIYDAARASLRISCVRRLRCVGFSALIVIVLWGMVASAFAAPADHAQILAPTPPMGWNDWAHYECTITAKDILANAKALVSTGLAARGYNTVTIDDCWMQKDRDAQGNLQARTDTFPNGIKPLAEAIHGMGLKFGIYEDAGYATCERFAGSGEPIGGGKDHFLQDARLFASWGVDFLKLDSCNIYIPKTSSKNIAYRKAYAAESAALKAVGRPIVFSESAPATFEGTPEWYDVLSWVPDYGQVSGEGSDIATFDPKNPKASHFYSVLWNYSHNLPLAQFQKPGHWNDPGFLIVSDSGYTPAETRSQLSLWAMMSAPLIISSDLDKISPQAVKILSNKAVIAIDQDALGKLATLVRRDQVMDVLFKPLSGGDYAVAVLNRGTGRLQVKLRPADLGFAASPDCRLDAGNLWSGKHQTAASVLQANITVNDTVIWRIRPASACGAPTRSGTITIEAGWMSPTIVHRLATNPPSDERLSINAYSRCLTALGHVGACMGVPEETWTITPSGALTSGGKCLAIVDGKPAMQACTASKDQHWSYTFVGNLVGADGQCLSADGPLNKPQSLAMQACGHNLPNQIWSLPN